MNKLHSLQALRGLAASLVILSHALQALHKYGFAPNSLELFYSYIGWLGVRIFFVISGFIMMSTSYDNFGNLRSVGTFVEKRLIRILPIYYIATLIMALLMLVIGQEIRIKALITSILFIPNVSDTYAIVEPILGQGWTLNYEMFFYLTFAISLIFPIHISLPGFLALFCGLSIINYFVNFHDIDPFYAALFGFYSDPIILLFSIGVLIAFIKRHFPTIAIKRGQIIIVACLCSFDILLNYFITSVLHHDMPHFLSYILAAGCVIACVFCDNTYETALTAISEKFGDASYSTYLFHTFVLAVLNRILPHHIFAYGIVYIIISIIGSNLLGYFIYIFVERPVSASLRNSISSLHAKIRRTKPAVLTRF